MRCVVSKECFERCAGQNERPAVGEFASDRMRAQLYFRCSIFNGRPHISICALLDCGIQNENPVMSRNTAISGKVVRSRFLRPNVSMVFMAGKANTKLTKQHRVSTPIMTKDDMIDILRPYPKLPKNACVFVKPPWEKMFVE